MAVSRILGASLQPELDRQGLDLYFTTNSSTLVYMDFANFRLGVNTNVPQQELHVVGNVLISSGNLLTAANISRDIGSSSTWWRNIYANTVTSNNFTASTFTGTLTTASQPNVTSLGTLTGLTASGNVNITTSNLQPSANLTSSLGFVNRWWNTVYANTVTATGYYGNVLSPYQPNITTLGNVTIGNLSVTGGQSILGNTSFEVIFANTIYEGAYRVLTTNSNVQVTGDVSGYGTYNNVAVTLQNTGVTPGVYSTTDLAFANRVPRIVVDSKGRITNIANVTLTRVGNVDINDVTISSNSTVTVSSIETLTLTTTGGNGNIILNPTGNGAVYITGDTALGLPAGDSGDRPTNPQPGYIRFNTSLGAIEYWDGSQWYTEDNDMYSLSSQNITPDGLTDTFLLANPATSTSLLVVINGTVQQPDVAYSISGNNIVFSEAPLSTDAVEIRQIAYGIASVQNLSYGDSEVNLDIANVNVTGNVIPSVTGVYDLGWQQYRWRNVWASNSSYSNTSIVSSNLLIGSGLTISSSANIAISTISTVTIDTFSKNLYRTAKYLIQASQGNNFESYEILVNHNGTTAYRTVYGVLTTGNVLGNISASISSNDVLIQYTSSYANTTVRLSKNYLNI